MLCIALHSDILKLRCCIRYLKDFMISINENLLSNELITIDISYNKW